MKIFLSEKKAVAFIHKTANSSFWDKHWQIDDLGKFIRTHQDVPFFTKYLKKYLNGESGIILEGGCGRGQLVYAIKNQGFNAVGVDFAKKTIEAISKAVPEIDVRVGDVRRLPFADNEVAGYYSLGVIEHFWEGYDQILSEMKRVIRPGGYLFITFPYMSPLRKLKVLLQCYGSCNDVQLSMDTIEKDFYQYALEHKQVVSKLEEAGFIVVEKEVFDGIKGCKDEVAFLQPILQKLYNYHGKSKMIRKLRRWLDKLLKPLASHCIFLVLKKV